MPEETVAPAPEEELSYQGKVVGFDELKPGMTIRVHERIQDVSPKGEQRERIQMFQGVVMGIRGSGISKTMTVRRLQKGYGVEKIYPMHSPNVVKVEVLKIAKVRRAKLSFLRDLQHRFRRKLKETRVDETK